MSDQEVLQKYIDFVPFLGEVLGPGCEIVIHNVADLEHSLVAICNGISGRKVGDPITDLACRLMERKACQEAPYVTNYKGTGKGGDFLCSTYFIKNEGRLIGMLCVNKDMTAVQEISNSLHALLERFNLAAPQEGESIENLDNSVTNMMHNIIANHIAQSGQTPSRMNLEEKVRVVHRLNEDGVLMMKGAVQEIARQLGVSVPTVYRYLNKAAE